MKTFRKLLAVLLAVSLCLSVCAFGVSADTQLVLEAEDALVEGTFYGFDWSTFQTVEIENPVEENAKASGGKNIGYMSTNGNTITWNVVADAAGTADLSLVLASCVNTWDYATWTCVSEAFVLEGHISITVNGSALNLTGLEAAGIGDATATSGSYDNYVEVSLGNVALNAGDNLIVLTVLDGTASANYDCLKVSNATVGVSAGTASGGSGMAQVTYEAEDALVEGTFAGMWGAVDSPVEENASASGGKSVGYMSAAGNKITWTVTVEQDCTTDLVLSLASCVHTMEMDASWALTKLIHEDFVLAGAVSVSVNGTELDLSGLKAPGLGDILATHGASYGCYDNFQDVVIQDVALTAGENVIVYTVLDGTTSANVDCLKVGDYTGPVSGGNSGSAGVPQVKYEAEDAETVGPFYGFDWTTWQTVEIEDPVETVESASGGKSVGYMSTAGNSIIWTVTMDEACVTDLTFGMASCVMNYDWSTFAFASHGDFVLAGAVSIAVNGVELDLTGIVAPGDPNATEANYYYFQDVVIKGVSLNAGENTVTLTVVDGTTNANYDYLIVGDATGSGSSGGNVSVNLIGTYEAEDAVIEGTPSYGDVFVEDKDSASGGKSVGYLSTNGNKVIWTVEVAEGGNYTLDFVLASGAMDWTTWGNADMTLSGDCVSITVNGSPVTVPSQLLPAGANYDNWQNVYIETTLNAGTNEIVLEIVDSTGTPNVDCLKVYEGHVKSALEGGSSSGGSTGGQSGTTIRMEAEDAILDCESSLASWGYTSNIYDSQYGASGGKCLAYMAVVGNKVTWTFDATEAGTVTLVFNLASGAMDESYNNLESILADDAKITLNGVELDLSGIVLPGGPQSGENWTLVTLTADVVAGSNTVVLEITSTSGPNVDYLEVSHDSIVFTDTCSGSGSTGGDNGGDWWGGGEEAPEEAPTEDTVFVPGTAGEEPNAVLATLLAAVIGGALALAVVLLITKGNKELLAVIVTTVAVVAIVCGYIANLVVTNVTLADVETFNHVLLPTVLAAVIGAVAGLAVVLLITKGNKQMLAVILTVTVVCAAVCGYITNLVTANVPGTDSDGVSEPTYTMVINGYDWGPGVDKLILDMGGEVTSLNGVSFGVSVSYQGWVGATEADREVSSLYLCDEQGNAVEGASRYIALEMPTDYNVSGGNPFYYDFMSGLNSWSNPYAYTVTMTSGSLKLTGGTYTALQITKSAGKISPVADLFRMDVSSTATGIQLHYAAYEPEELTKDNVKNALIIWLHGAGEGGTDPYIDILGNRVTALAEEEIQSCFDGNGAYVLAPQSPTMWMDDGSGEYTSESKSMYTNALKALIDEYVAGNPDVDPDRIIIGGCSNGGFMTMNMILSYPDYFAAAYPICEAYYDSNITDDMLASIKDLPIWFTHAANDTTVDPAGTTVATYDRLIAMGAKNVYYTEWPEVIDSQGVAQMGHWSWIYTLNNDCTETVNGSETTIWAWLAQQSK